MKRFFCRQEDVKTLKKNLAIAVAVFSIATTGHAQVVQDNPKQLQGIDVVEHLGDYIPLDLTFVNSEGDSVRLDNYFQQGKPVLLVLAYYECPMLCTLVLNGVTNGLQSLPWMPGKQFQVVTVSIDPNEGPELAAQKKQRYLDALNKPGMQPGGWDFLVGAESQSRALANALGFQYYYDEEQEMWAHPAVIFVLTEDGKISRYLYGIAFKENDLRLALLEASQGKIGNTLDRLILYCYHYNPDSQSYVPFALNLMKVGGIATVLILGVFVGILLIKDKKRS